MISPANRVPREKKLASRRLAGTATTSAPRNDAPMRSSASCSVATFGPSGSHMSTCTPARSCMTSAIVALPREQAAVVAEQPVEQAQHLGGGGGAPQNHELPPVPLLVVDALAPPLVGQARPLGGGGGAAQNHDLHPVPFLVVDDLDPQLVGAGVHPGQHERAQPVGGGLVDAVDLHDARHLDVGAGLPGHSGPLAPG